MSNTNFQKQVPFLYNEKINQMICKITIIHLFNQIFFKYLHTLLITYVVSNFTY